MVRKAVFAVLLCVLPLFTAEAGPAANNAQVSSAFGSDCDEMLIKQVDSAKKELVVAIYSFTHQTIARSYARASARGVKVYLKYDEEQADWVGMQAALKILRKAGIKCTPIKMSQKYSGMHHKFTVIDGQKVLTGSFNYSAAGSKRNYENLVLISSKAIATAYKKEFDKIKSR